MGAWREFENGSTACLASLAWASACSCAIGIANGVKDYRRIGSQALTGAERKLLGICKAVVIGISVRIRSGNAQGVERRHGRQKADNGD